MISRIGWLLLRQQQPRAETADGPPLRAPLGSRPCRRPGYRRERPPGTTHLFYFGRSDDYLILRRRSTTELHLSRSPDRDTHRTAESGYLRVTDTQPVDDSERAELAREGALYLAPDSEDRSQVAQRSR